MGYNMAPCEGLFLLVLATTVLQQRHRYILLDQLKSQVVTKLTMSTPLVLCDQSFACWVCIGEQQALYRALGGGERRGGTTRTTERQLLLLLL